MKRQTTLYGRAEKKITNKNAMRSKSLRFHPCGTTFEGIIDDLDTMYGRTKCYVLASGGRDSMYVTDRLARLGRLESVVHIKTNIGLQMTTDFLRDYCNERGWPLRVIEPAHRYVYASHVLEYGFPGPQFHRIIMGKIKYKTMRDFALSVDRRRHVLISGIRKYESKRRMGNFASPIQSDGFMWFGCPAFYMSAQDVYEYVHKEGLKVSPAYKWFNTSGECMCGSYAGIRDKSMLAEADPPLSRYIAWLEEGVREFGSSHAKRYPTWGGAARISEIAEQTAIDDFVKRHPEMAPVNEMEEYICGIECGPGTMRGATDY